ncbi:(2Fe-2S)-binding protein [Clostridium uliginosum]|uniref:BFD-like [2Fe-2S] binding domain-containing protein n=1 Tax=Clostridium uliginosum TaxID=119641 RepID=A0A1I1LFX4_9CLOT|nr:(2Fe-2S)-binding protein [Clostridium uliginosum]SFC68400.1 BFD-like [2Fe-2S] binding domain-containing protein [Clostridium uliginosum]
MENNLNKEILDKLTKTCTCRSITRAKIKECIKNGASSLEEVQKATGAGLGSCKGRKCSDKIKTLLKEINN